MFTHSTCNTHQIMEVLPDLPDDSRKGGPQQLLYIRGPGHVPAICLQVINPLSKERKRDLSLRKPAHERRKQDAAHVNSGAADVHGVVRVRGLDVELEDVVDVGCVDEQTAQTLHDPRLIPQHIKNATKTHEQSHLTLWPNPEKTALVILKTLISLFGVFEQGWRKLCRTDD